MVSPPRLDIKVQFKDVEKLSGLTSRFVYAPDDKEVKRTCLKSAQYWTSNVPISTRAAHVIQRLCNVPLIDGLPLGFYVVTENNYDTKELQTRYAAPRHFDSKVFDVPGGFRVFSNAFDYWNTSIGVTENSDSLLEFFPSKTTK